MTDNELIARFMGGVKQKCTSYSIHDYPNELPKFILKDLKYHKSFDWLMPVVEKIETLYDTGIFYDGHRQPDVQNVRIYAKRGGSETIIVAYGKSKIETVYTAVVKFIQWHNQQKNDSPSS